MVPCTRDQQYTADDFYQQFCQDLDAAKYYCWLMMPYLSSSRYKELRPHLEKAIKKCVRVCMVFMDPRRWKKGDDHPDVIIFEEIVRWLRDLGVHVSIRIEMHEKIAIIDDVVVWHGSLNAMSHGITTEHMERSTEYVKLRQIAKLHRAFDCPQCPESVRRYFLSPSVEQRLREIGDYIARQRKSVGLTQNELSEQAGVRQQILSQIERGERDCRLSTMWRVADALGLEFSVMLRILGPASDGINSRSLLLRDSKNVDRKVSFALAKPVRGIRPTKAT